MSRHTPPIWFWLISGICLIWNIVGLITFGMHVHVNEVELAAMSPQELYIYNTTPLYVTLAFGVAGTIGLLASISLLLQSKVALLLFRLSLVATTLQLFHSLFLSNAYTVLAEQAIIMPIMVMLIAISLCLFARFSRYKGWLR